MTEKTIDTAQAMADTLASIMRKSGDNDQSILLHICPSTFMVISCFDKDANHTNRYEYINDGWKEISRDGQGF